MGRAFALAIALVAIACCVSCGGSGDVARHGLNSAAFAATSSDIQGIESALSASQANGGGGTSQLTAACGQLDGFLSVQLEDRDDLVQYIRERAYDCEVNAQDAVADAQEITSAWASGEVGPDFTTPYRFNPATSPASPPTTTSPSGTDNQALAAAVMACDAFKGYVVDHKSFPDPAHIDIYAQGADEEVGSVPVSNFEPTVLAWVQAGAPTSLTSPTTAAVAADCQVVGVTISAPPPTLSPAEILTNACEAYSNFDYATGTAASAQASLGQIDAAKSLDPTLVQELHDWAQNPAYSSNGEDADIETRCANY